MITAAKETLGERVKILGHFYQRDEVVTSADFVGDSFNLAKEGRCIIVASHSPTVTDACDELVEL